MNLGKDEQRPTGRGCAETNAARRAPRVPKARLAGWLLADQAQPVRLHCRGAKRSAAGMGCPADPLESGHARSAHDQEEKQRAVGPLRHSSPRSAKLTTSLPATIR